MRLDGRIRASSSPWLRSGPPLRVTAPRWVKVFGGNKNAPRFFCGRLAGYSMGEAPLVGNQAG
jgi:hypothetical protein